MKNYTPLDGLRWSRNSDSALNNVPQTDVLGRAGGEYAPNSKVQEANKVAESIAKELNCRYIDLYSLYADKNNELPRKLTIDGVHLYPNSYDRWAEKIKCLVYE